MVSSQLKFVYSIFYVFFTVDSKSNFLDSNELVSVRNGISDKFGDLQPGSRIGDYKLTEKTASLGTFLHSVSLYEFSSLNLVDPFTVSVAAIDGSSISSLEYQCLQTDQKAIFVDENYHFKEKFDKGSHGEVWRARLFNSDKITGQNYVLKRIFVEKGEEILQMGLREVHFGDILRDVSHVTRFVEFFYRPSSKLSHESNELWLVFRDEGLSMRNYLYSKHLSGQSVVFEPSEFWRKLRTERSGAEVLKETMRQLIEGVAKLHKRGITHRDIKPSNILINNMHTPPEVKLADFGSAINAYTLMHMYDPNGPTQAEETREYQPPEVLFNKDIPYYLYDPKTYDIWSIGVVFLELFLGTPNVFTINSRDRARLDHELKSKSEKVRQESYVLHSLAEFCIYNPSSMMESLHSHALVASSCNIGEFNLTLMKKDPLKKGFQDPWGLHLLWSLLQWSPQERITLDNALEHAYFHGPYICEKSKRQFATKQELELHQKYLSIEKRRYDKMKKYFVLKIESPSEFRCPHCHRSFQLWHSCNLHMKTRKHDQNLSFCIYEKNNLSSSYSESSQCTPREAYFDLQGRRAYMEDVHFIQHSTDYSLYSIMDGHNGKSAALHIERHLAQLLDKNLKNISMQSQILVDLAIKQTVTELHETFLHEEHSEFSGSTLTFLLHYKDNLITANLGDSRAILIQEKTEKKEKNVLQLTVDHHPDSVEERKRIESSGGFIEFSGLWRVMGQLAVSRSIGDRHLRQYLSLEPSITHLKLSNDDKYVILASDGVWETMSNEEVGNLIQENLQPNCGSTCLQNIVKDVAYEAYVRGSTDNIAVLLVDLQSKQISS